MQSFLDSLATTEEVTDGTVETGDTVNIDYTGYIDGETFEGGSATGADLTIGSNSFIDGFETGLIGKKTEGGDAAPAAAGDAAAPAADASAAAKPAAAAPASAPAPAPAPASSSSD